MSALLSARRSCNPAFLALTTISLHLQRKKGYKRGVPICPHCSATIHAGAEDQCPACGYSLLRANIAFGENQKEFPRVFDDAGALTHRERVELLLELENLERRLPPIALGIYITDDGHAQDLRAHAHWILNHARIHHPSFGKRQQSKYQEMIDASELRERKPGEERPQDISPIAEPTPSVFTRLWNSLCVSFRDLVHPCPPPVRQEWMLILVVDVQLEMACFSWGYQLDPYINPDSINRSIVKARLQFRERDMVSGLKKVMRSAVRLIAADAHKVNRRLKNRLPQMRRGLSIALLGGALLSLPTQAAPARQAHVSAPVLQLTDDDIAEEVEDDTAEEAGPEDSTPRSPAATATETPASPSIETPTAPPHATEPPTAAKPASSADNAASFSEAPRWKSEHYRLLMAGELETGYTALFANAADPATTSKALKASAGKNKKNENDEESDTTVLGRYCDEYLHPKPELSLIDPQKLLSSPETDDVSHVLRQLNANSNYRVCIALFRGTQDIPGELSAGTLVSAVAQQSCDYAVLISYPLGQPDRIDIGYREIKTEDARRHEWLNAVRRAAAEAGDGADGVIAAIRSIHAAIKPLSADFKLITPENAQNIPLIPLELTNKTEKEPSTREKFRKMLENPDFLRLCLPLLIPVLGLALFCIWFFWLRRQSAILYDSEPDMRLASPYGAGVSRYVRYLEGKESDKEKSLF